ncbi:MAG TPA: hypothetical protein VJP87_06025 [Candidatus Acidoferrales bacterium]|nr:hypothetical protein [Candidatus Acidoferrales bacterium]
MRSMALLGVLGVLWPFLRPTAAWAASPSFDLTGPRIEMTVDRGGKKLPIAEVAGLQAGDRLWIHPVFPSDQAVHFLLIVAFLQGTTNPPPEQWFTRVETWTKQAQQEGAVVTVPQGAQQALMFLAPETGGDFSTLRSTVRGRPGVFVRATRDLEQASLDRTRLDKYLEEIRETSESDPAELKKRSTLLAQTLHIKVDEECFRKPTDQQTSCLTQNSDQLVIDDAHSESVVAMLTSGPSSDLITALGSSPVARGGYYSPYFGAVVDAARLLNNLHTASYQYLPALSLAENDRLNLKLNTPPSFHNPKSVLVVGLPPIGTAPLPPLRLIDAKEAFCLQKSPLVVPVEGAPLVFSTAIGHGFVLHITGKSGDPLDLPAAADAARGGFLIDTQSLPSNLSSKLTGTLRGHWGFAAFDGPSFGLRVAHSERWTITPADANALTIGHDAVLHLQSDDAACVEKVEIEDARGKELKTTWKLADPDRLEVSLSLKDETAGEMKMKIAQFGLNKPDLVSLRSYAEAAHLEGFTLSMGDSEGVLSGSGLNEVSSLELKGIHFEPVRDAPAAAREMKFIAKETAQAASLQANETLSAHATLKDGRTIELQASVKPPRPKVSLVSKSVQAASGAAQVRFTGSDELPQNARLSFFLKAETPAHFSHSEKIEVETADGAFRAELSVADGTLIPQDTKSVLAILDPLKAFGPGAFGQLRFRAVEPDGAKGDWEPLATLVRVPSLKEVRCPESADKKCTLSGGNLFLLDSVSSDAQFKDSVAVPEGYVNDSLSVPRPVGTLLYLKLRDDPATVGTVALPVLPED